MSIHFLISKRYNRKISPWLYTLSMNICRGFNNVDIEAKKIESGRSFLQKHFLCVRQLFQNNSYSKYLITDDLVLINPLISILCRFYGGKHIIILHALPAEYRLYHPTNLFIGYFRYMATFLSLMFAHDIWANSQHTASRAIAVGKNANKIHIPHLPVAPLMDSAVIEQEGTKYQETNFQQCVNWLEKNAEHKTLLDVNAITEYKQPEHLLQALQSVKTPCTAIFVGPKKAPHIFKRLQKLAKQLTTTTHHKVFFLENIPHVSLEWLRSKTTLGIQPSIYEGFGFAPLELARHSITTIARDIEVNREILQDTAIYYQPKNPADELAQVIQSSLENPILLQEKGIKAKQNVERFNLETIIEKAVKTFKFTPSANQANSPPKPEADQPPNLEEATITNHEDKVNIPSAQEVVFSEKTMADKTTIESKKTTKVTDKSSATVSTKPAVAAQPEVKVATTKPSSKAPEPAKKS